MHATTASRPPGRRRVGTIARAFAAGTVALIAVVGCNDATRSADPPNASAAPASVAPPVSASPATAPSASPARVSALIPQPDVGDLPSAPDAARVDLRMPTFSDPTEITNPLFPVSSQRSVLLLGQVDDQVFRTEVTLLPTPRIIEWGGQQVATLVSQYVAFLDGRIHEVAYDYYAQDDAGNVWYFGEDVFNFADGAIVDTHGTWLAGTDGPAAMIMPAKPKVGDVYRPENVPGLVFEEVTVEAIDETLDGPLGPIPGGLVIKELHMDGATEDKTFAPGYGEFFTGGGGDVEAMALAVPTDLLTGPAPLDLVAIGDSASLVLAAARAGDWAAAATALAAASDAWQRFRTAPVPAMIASRIDDAVARLADAVDRRQGRRAWQAAIDLARSALDLELRHRPVSAIERGRFGLWLEQLLLDAALRRAGAMYGDFFGLDYTRERFLHTLDAADAARINLELEELLSAIGDEDFKGASTVVRELQAVIEGLPSAE